MGLCHHPFHQTCPRLQPDLPVHAHHAGRPREPHREGVGTSPLSACLWGPGSHLHRSHLSRRPRRLHRPLPPPALRPRANNLAGTLQRSHLRFRIQSHGRFTHSSPHPRRHHQRRARLRSRPSQAPRPPHPPQRQAPQEANKASPRRRLPDLRCSASQELSRPPEEPHQTQSSRPLPRGHEHPHVPNRVPETRRCKEAQLQRSGSHGVGARPPQHTQAPAQPP